MNGIGGRGRSRTTDETHQVMHDGCRFVQRSILVLDRRDSMRWIHGEEFRLELIPAVHRAERPERHTRRGKSDTFTILLPNEWETNVSGCQGAAR